MTDLELTGYKSAKRLLLISSFVLLVSEVVGLKLNSDVLLGPISIAEKNDNLLSLASASLTLFFQYRFVLEWGSLDIQERKISYNLYDHVVCFLISYFVMAFYCIAQMPNGYIYFSFSAVLFSSILACIVINQTDIVGILIYNASNLFSSKYEKEDSELDRLATLVEYKLYYSPDFPFLYKIMKFGEGGAIVKGQNSNEATWDVYDGKLNIYNSKKLLQSSFRFNRRRLVWTHTNSIRSRSTRNQYMLIHESEASGGVDTLHKPQKKKPA